MAIFLSNAVVMTRVMAVQHNFTGALDNRRLNMSTKWRLKRADPGKFYAASAALPPKFA